MEGSHAAETAANPDVIVKFREGGELDFTPQGFMGQRVSLAYLERVLAERGEGVAARQSFGVPGFQLRRFTQIARRNLASSEVSSLRRDLPSLDLFVRVRSEPGSVDVHELAEQLRSDPDGGVEYAVVAAIPGPPPSPIPYPPDFTPQQGYLGPKGVNAEFAWGVPGGKGEWFWVCDCEYGFGEHRDLEVHVVSNRDGSLLKDAVHGTNVLGVVGGKADGAGITGIANRSTLLFASESGGMRDKCIADALTWLIPGDVLLLEMQDTNNLPAEYDRDVHELIATATGLGVVTVAAAGNGSHNLDDHGDSNDELVWKVGSKEELDSGAIIVGSGAPSNWRTPHAMLAHSNHGSRVDCQGWGEDVATAGGLDLYWDGATGVGYTADFGGTSSAAAMIAGCVACLQGAAYQAFGHVLKPERVRELLRDPTNGVVQADSPEYPAASHQIGPLPDLERVFAAASI